MGLALEAVALALKVSEPGGDPVLDAGFIGLEFRARVATDAALAAVHRIAALASAPDAPGG